ncbi:MAG: CHAT domain-containing protein [Anaerolineales bacterium]|nr:CHAT domain-containing protein [Anaerolineales bacterium]
MTEQAISIDYQDQLLYLVAICGEVSPVILVEMSPFDEKQALLEWVQGQEGVALVNGRFHIQPDIAHHLLTQLENNDATAYRHMHEHVLSVFANSLRQGDFTYESAFAVVFERLANRLLKDDPERLMAVVMEMQQLEGTAVSTHYTIQYFEAVALRKAEQYETAVAKFDALLAAPDLQDHLRGRVLNSRAICYRLLGRLEDALNGYTDSLALWQKLGDQLNSGKVLLNLGIVAYQLQDYETAEVRLTAAAALFSQHGSAQWLAAAQNELGLVLRDQGKWDEALAAFAHLVDQRRLEGAQDAVGRGLNNMGEVFLLQGQLENALTAFQEALGLMTTRVYRVDTFVHLGLAYQAMGNRTAAQNAYERALTIALEIGRRDVLPNIYLRLGEILERNREFDAALVQWETAVAIIETSRDPMQDEALKISLLGRWQQIFERLVLLCVQLGRDAAAFSWAERARARAYAEAVLTDQSEVVSATAVQAYLDADSQLLCYFTTGVLAQDAPMLSNLSTDNPLRTMLRVPGHTLLFAINQTQIKIFDCGIDPNLLASSSPRSNVVEQFWHPATSKQLYELLILPALTRSTQADLIIIPHGPLHHIPFNALLDANGVPLVNPTGSTVTYTPSATMFVSRKSTGVEKLAPTKTCLALSYEGDDHFLQFAPLEARAAAKLLGGDCFEAGVLRGDNLRETAVGYRRLHFACHGWFNQADPLESYLVIAPDEQLTAREIIKSWQIQAELVVLSACQTGVSHILRGDEAMGLTRAFLYAGAGAVLVTQWPVADLPAFLLIMRFYELLESGLELSAALHQAQSWLQTVPLYAVIETINKLKRDYRLEEDMIPRIFVQETFPFAHPQYWAAFVLII